MDSWNIPVYGKKRELLIIGSEKSALVNYLTPSEYEIFDSNIRKRKINDNLYIPSRITFLKKGLRKWGSMTFFSITLWRS